MSNTAYTVLVIGIHNKFEYWQRKIADTARHNEYWINLLERMLFICVALWQENRKSVRRISRLNAHSNISLNEKARYLKQNIRAVQIEYLKENKASILMKAQKVVVVISIVLFAGAVGLLGYRGVKLLEQQQSEIAIEKMYMETQPVKVDTHDIPGEVIIDPTREAVVLYPDTLPQFTKLLVENEDTIGWLTIDNTRIDHVVMQGEDNIFYLEHDYFGNKSISASMMLDALCDINNIKYHYVIYGHRMKSGTMMNDILKYEDKDFFYDNPVISFNTIYQKLEWEVFSTYCNNYEYDNKKILFDNDDEWLEYITRLQDASIYDTDIILTADDVVLTLYTCDYRMAGGRYVVHARLKK